MLFTDSQRGLCRRDELRPAPDASVDLVKVLESEPGPLSHKDVPRYERANVRTFVLCCSGLQENSEENSDTVQEAHLERLQELEPAAAVMPYAWTLVDVAIGESILMLSSQNWRVDPNAVVASVVAFGLQAQARGGCIHAQSPGCPEAPTPTCTRSGPLSGQYVRKHRALVTITEVPGTRTMQKNYKCEWCNHDESALSVKVASRFIRRQASPGWPAGIELKVGLPPALCQSSVQVFVTLACLATFLRILIQKK